MQEKSEKNSFKQAFRINNCDNLLKNQDTLVIGTPMVVSRAILAANFLRAVPGNLRSNQPYQKWATVPMVTPDRNIRPKRNDNIISVIDYCMHIPGVESRYEMATHCQPAVWSRSGEHQNIGMVNSYEGKKGERSTSN